MLAQVTQSIFAIVANFLLIVAMLTLPLLMWSKIRQWNRERNEKLDSISKELKKIKESLSPKQK
jgi:di/tricarboxylate transporter